MRPSEYPCSYGGQIYQPGDVYPATDGCNACMCTSDGDSSCTQRGCELDTSECAPASGEAWNAGTTHVRVSTDAATKVCVWAENAGRVCINGRAQATTDPDQWSGGIELVFSTSVDAGRAPFDAAALGATGLHIAVNGLFDSFKLRPALSMQNVASTSSDEHNFENNPFLSTQWPELFHSGIFTLRFDELKQPEWSQLDIDGDGDIDQDTAFDPSSIDTFKLLVIPEPAREFYFELCLSDVEWVDDQGRALLY